MVGVFIGKLFYLYKSNEKSVMKKIKSLVFLSVLGCIACDNEVNESHEASLLEVNTVASEVAAEEVEGVLDDIVMYSESTFGVNESTSKTATAKESVDKKRGRSKFFNTCADIVSEEQDGVRTTTITFNEGCEDRHGNIISGTITKVKSKTDTGRDNTVTINNLTINGYVVNGTKVYAFVTSNDNGNPEMTGSVDMTIETDEGTKTKVGNRTVEITSGGDSDTCYDDEKTITGTSIYTNADGLSRTVTITTALIKPAACRFIASGVKTYEMAAGTLTLDFGDGTCDNEAIFTGPNGVDHVIILN